MSQKKYINSLKESIKSVIKEDLGVWFGTKKKPKGSNQPKGPWVNICKKDKNGKHPPCGRPEATDKAYPKCRAAGVAGKMSDSEKRNACSQKRKAEKSHNKSGTGNAPKMVSHKKTNEEMKTTVKLTESQLINLIKRVISEQTNPSETDLINVNCWSPSRSANFKSMIFKELKNEQGKKVLYLSRASNLPSDSAYNNESVRFVFEQDQIISQKLGLSEDDYFLKNYTGGEKWCFVNMSNANRNETWEEFIRENNIQNKLSS